MTALTTHKSMRGAIAAGTIGILLGSLPAALAAPLDPNAPPQLKAEKIEVPNARGRPGPQADVQSLKGRAPATLKMDTEVIDLTRRTTPISGYAPGTASAPSTIKGVQPAQTGARTSGAVKYSPAQSPVSGSKARDAVKWEGPEYDMARKKPGTRSNFNPKE